MTEPLQTPTPRERLGSLDVMRGLTILAMILVNNPGTWAAGARFGPLDHADWHGWTPTDLIFPFFLFMVGVAMAYSFAKYVDGAGRPTRAVWIRIFRRVGTLILLGLLLNASGRLIGVPLGYQQEWGWGTLRWPGVLQRIGLAYLGAAPIVLLTGKRGWVVAAILLLGFYTAALKLAPRDVLPADRLTPTSNVVRAIDVALIGEAHMWTRATSRPTDPEGLLSTLPSIVTVLIGYAVGRVLRESPITLMGTVVLFGAGLSLAAIGQAWGRLPSERFAMPINKALWTPSFVLLAGGLGTAALAACLLVFDQLGRASRWTGRLAVAFQLVGVNAIFVFVASGLVARAMTVVKIDDQTIKAWLYERVFVEPLSAVGIGDARVASLAYAVAFVGCWWLVLGWMWRRGISFRV